MRMRSIIIRHDGMPFIFGKERVVIYVCHYTKARGGWQLFYAFERGIEILLNVLLNGGLSACELGNVYIRKIGSSQSFIIFFNVAEKIYFLEGSSVSWQRALTDYTIVHRRL